jgi:hypothetical protein
VQRVISTAAARPSCPRVLTVVIAPSAQSQMYPMKQMYPMYAKHFGSYSVNTPSRRIAVPSRVDDQRTAQESYRTALQKSQARGRIPGLQAFICGVRAHYITDLMCMWVLCESLGLETTITRERQEYPLSATLSLGFKKMHCSWFCWIRNEATECICLEIISRC